MGLPSKKQVLLRPFQAKVALKEHVFFTGWLQDHTSLILRYSSWLDLPACQPNSDEHVRCCTLLLKHHSGSRIRLGIHLHSSCQAYQPVSVFVGRPPPSVLAMLKLRPGQCRTLPAFASTEILKTLYTKPQCILRHYHAAKHEMSLKLNVFSFWIRISAWRECSKDFLMSFSPHPPWRLTIGFWLCFCFDLRTIVIHRCFSSKAPF